jgi:hypothetical protein
MAHVTGHAGTTGTMGTKGKGRMAECIERCLECHKVCIQVIAQCLHKGGEHAAPEHIRLLLDCAEICQTSANFMLRGSEHHTQTCGVCADVCEACTEDCERLGDAMMKQCAEACRRCAASCSEMARMA